MLVTRIQLHNFRNYAGLDMCPHAALSVLVGDNAQGKTNLLECIVFCATGRSHRTSRDAEMIAFDQSTAKIQLDIQKTGYHTRLMVEQSQRKQIQIDGKSISRMSELMGAINVVLFSPEDLRLVKDTPALRRRFMDMELSQMQKAYFLCLQRYTRALNQRNALLRSGQAAGTVLDSFDEPLCAAAGEIIYRRMNFVFQLGEIARETHRIISGGKEHLFVRYIPCVEGSAPEEIAEKLHLALKNARAEDMRRGVTGVGPHRDDIELQIEGHDVRAFGSQGQQRTAALSIKLAEITLMERETGEKPVLLLDDVMSELDDYRCAQLLEFSQHVQTFLTCTQITGPKLQNAAYYRVASGTLSEAL